MLTRSAKRTRPLYHEEVATPENLTIDAPSRSPNIIYYADGTLYAVKQPSRHGRRVAQDAGPHTKHGEIGTPNERNETTEGKTMPRATKTTETKLLKTNTERDTAASKHYRSRLRLGGNKPQLRKPCRPRADFRSMGPQAYSIAKGEIYQTSPNPWEFRRTRPA